MKKFEKVITIGGIVASILCAITSYYVGNRSAAFGWGCSALWAFSHLSSLFQIDDLQKKMEDEDLGV